MKPTWVESPSLRELRLPDDRPVWMISDLHLGDGSRSDAFMQKDRALLDLLDRVEAEGARLVIVGDAIDFLQAHDFTPVVKAHGKLLGRIGELAVGNGVVYLHGNHDYDIRVYQDLLRWQVCARLWIGDHIVVQHGHQFDPFIGDDVSKAGWITKIHHAIERHFAVWIRLPIADFYTPGNRLAFWTGYRIWQLLKVRNWFLERCGGQALAARSYQFSSYWARSEAGDPMSLPQTALGWARANDARVVVCGHSHLPGTFESDGVRYVNTGSWTFQWGQAVRYENGVFVVRDQLSGRTYGDELYRPLLDGDLDGLDFDRWWRNQYLGWFRFRTGELKKRYGSAA